MGRSRELQRSLIYRDTFRPRRYPGPFLFLLGPASEVSGSLQDYQKPSLPPFRCPDFTYEDQPADRRASLQKFTNTVCKQITSAVEAMHKRRTAVIQKVQDSFDLLERMVPNKDIRNKRDTDPSPSIGAIPEIGVLAEQLFGVASTQSLLRIRRKVMALSQLVTNNEDAINKVQTQYLSLVNATQQQFHAVWTGIHQENELTKTLSSQLDSSNAYISTLEWLTQLQLSLQIDNLHNKELEDQVLDASRKWSRSIQLLNEGYLGVELIPPQTLQKNLDDVQNILETRYNKLWQLQTSKAADYYRRNDMTFALDKDTLLINVPIPLQSTGSLYNLYQIIKYPLAINESTSNSSLLSNTADFIGVSQDSQRYYVLMSHSDFNGCTKHNNVYRCPTVASSVHFDTKTCTSSLWANDQENIHKLCQFSYSADSLEERVIALEGSSDLIISTNVTKWNELCIGQNSPREIDGCRNCRIKPRCGCSLWCDAFRIPARLTGCEPPSTNPLHLRKFPVNFGLLSSFSSTALPNVNSKSQYTFTPIVKAPDFKIHEKKLDNVVQIQTKFDQNLKAIARNVQKDQISFRAKSDAIHTAEELGSYNIGDISTFNYLDIIEILFSIFVIIGIIYLFWKYRILALSLAAIQSLKLIDSAPIHRADIEIHRDPVNISALNYNTSGISTPTLPPMPVALPLRDQPRNYIETHSGYVDTKRHPNSVRNPYIDKHDNEISKSSKSAQDTVDQLYEQSKHHPDLQPSNAHNFSNFPFKPITTYMESWLDNHHSSPTSLIIYIVGFALLFFVLTRLWRKCFKKIHKIQIQKENKDCQLILCFHEGSKSLYFPVADHDQFVHQVLLVSRPIRVESIELIRQGYGFAKLHITWTTGTVSRCRKHHFTLPSYSVPKFIGCQNIDRYLSENSTTLVFAKSGRQTICLTDHIYTPIVRPDSYVNTRHSRHRRRRDLTTPGSADDSRLVDVTGEVHIADDTHLLPPPVEQPGPTPSIPPTDNPRRSNPRRKLFDDIFSDEEAISPLQDSPILH